MTGHNYADNYMVLGLLRNITSYTPVLETSERSVSLIMLCTQYAGNQDQSDLIRFQTLLQIVVV